MQDNARTAPSPKPWPVEHIPDDERVIIYDPEQPLQARFDVAYRYIWSLRAAVANLSASDRADQRAISALTLENARLRAEVARLQARAE